MATPERFEEFILFEDTVARDKSDACVRAFKGDKLARLQLALELADEEYHHPHCEAARTRPDQRSFCFHHDRITPKAVLLIHGFTACPYEMRELGQYLHHQGFNVFGARLAGHGTSVKDFSQTGAIDWEKSARKGLAITALLGEEVIVVGESMGGALAAILAQSFPDLVNSVVLCAPAFLIANRMAYLTHWGWVRKLIPNNDMGVKYEWQFPYWYQVIPTSAIAELVKVATRGLAAAAEIQASTLVIQATDDKIIDYRGSKSFFQKLAKVPEDQKELLLFSNGHHNLTIDFNPRKREVFKWIERFVGV